MQGKKSGSSKKNSECSIFTMTAGTVIRIEPSPSRDYGDQSTLKFHTSLAGWTSRNERFCSWKLEIYCVAARQDLVGI